MVLSEICPPLMLMPEVKQQSCPLGSVCLNISILFLATLIILAAFKHLKEDVKHERHLEDVGTGIGQSHRHKLESELASGPPQRGGGRSPQFRRARPAPIKPEV